MKTFKQTFANGIIIILTKPIYFYIDFQEDGAAYHNLYRNIHHSPSLKLNQTVKNLKYVTSHIINYEQ